MDKKMFCFSSVNRQSDVPAAQEMPAPVGKKQIQPDYRMN